MGSRAADPRLSEALRTGRGRLMRVVRAYDNGARRKDARRAARTKRETPAHNSGTHRRPVNEGQPAFTRTSSRLQSVQASFVCSMKKLPPGTSFTITIRIGELSTVCTNSPPSWAIETV